MKTDRKQQPAPATNPFGRKANETATECARRLVQASHAQVKREQANAAPKGSAS